WDTIAMAIESGVMEELLMRAIVLRLLMRAFGIWPALALQALLFGALHLANPNATLTAAVAIAIEAGLMLAGFYLLTGRLWMSIGVHAAWNFTQGWIWGASVSGIPVKESWLVSTPKPGAPEFLSGGAFGPEASLPAMVVGTSVAVVVLWMAWRKGMFQARPDAAPEGSVSA
ncbi:MAG: CPBP family intramembrane metalloprotease, partial [Caulobacter sp.]|nr:CPBP family intramembrane metalloprotease [Caulobacter sp.]